jgi:hypothetical protein
MQRFLIICLIVIVIVAVSIVALNNDAASSQMTANFNSSPKLTPTVEQTPKAKDFSIRRIDFSNFTFQGSKGLFPTAEYETKTYTLVNGKSEQTEDQYAMDLGRVEYGDVTGDNAEEAMISLAVLTEGSAGVNHVYIYTLENNRPKFLWGFESGDRAWGGLNRVYAENGELVVELFGKGTQIGGELGSTEPVGLCCPRSFTRTRYQWRSNHFQQRGEIEVLPYERKSR